MKSQPNSDAPWTSSRSPSGTRVKSWQPSLRTRMRSRPATSRPIKPAETGFRKSYGVDHRGAPGGFSLRTPEPTHTPSLPLNLDLRLLVEHHVQQRAVHV